MSDVEAALKTFVYVMVSFIGLGAAAVKGAMEEAELGPNKEEAKRFLRKVFNDE